MPLHFLRPEWLLLLLPASALCLLLWRQRQRGGSWSSVIAPELLHYLVTDTATGKRRNYLPLIMLGWTLAVIAASGPSWEKIPQPVHQKQDALVLLLDLSYSMKSPDLPPSRVDRARQKLLDLLKQRNEGQTAVVAYAGDAHVVTPLTDDTATIANLLPALHPDMMPLAGSNPVSAVEQGLALLRSAGIRNGRLLLLTDGIRDAQLATLEDTLHGSGATLGVMGIGTPTGAPIPLPRGGFVKDRKGGIVMPGLQEGPLRALASAGGGVYRRMQIDNSDIDALLAGAPYPQAARATALSRTTDTWDDKGHWFLLPLLPLALALFRRGWLLLMLPLLLAQPQPALAQSWRDLWLTPDQQGMQALEGGKPADAAELFENPQWSGLAAYRSEDYARAAEHFARGDSADDWYNRGNALARAGDLEAAIDAYRQSLERAPGQADAQANLDLVERLKEAQQQQQQQQQGQDQEQDQQNQDQRNQASQNGQPPDQPSQRAEESAPQQQPGSRAQDEQQQPGGQTQPADAQDGDEQAQASSAAGQEAPPGQPAQAESRDADPATDDVPGSAAPAPGDDASPEERERDQALEQWLRRVPDDPSGLLREKFRYESELRQQQGNRREESDDIFW
ncbi:MAG: VWA domain-containing protein [Halioglobus sp.]